MFRGTNFTESNQSYRNVEGEMKIAAHLWKHFHDLQCRTRGDRAKAAYHFACETYEELVGPMPTKQVRDLSEDQMGIWMIQAVATDGYAEWAENAFPRVQMSHSFAAMLMATTVSAKELGHVQAPWGTFIIEIPEKLLPIQAKGIESSITRIYVNTDFMPPVCPERWWSLCLQGPRIELIRAGTLHDLVTDEYPTDGDHPLLRLHPEYRTEIADAPIIEEERDAFWQAYDQPQEERIVQLATRLLVGVCIMMTERANYTQRDIDLDKKLGELSDPRRKIYAERNEKLPESRIYTLGKPVKLDLRLAVKAFLEGRSKGPMTVQRLVAGHHKNQPHGPNNSLRKWIFVEPYWQGPSDSPIVVRPHRG